MVARTRLSVKLYVQCLSCFVLLPKMIACLESKALLSVRPHKEAHSPFGYYCMRKINGTALWCLPLDNFHITFRRKRSEVETRHTSTQHSYLKSLFLLPSQEWKHVLKWRVWSTYAFYQPRTGDKIQLVPKTKTQHILERKMRCAWP